MKKVKIVKSNDGWEALYLNDVLVDQGDPINEGEDRGIYFLKFAYKHGLNVNDFKVYYLIDKGNNILEKTGRFPQYFNEIKNN